MNTTQRRSGLEKFHTILGVHIKDIDHMISQIECSPEPLVKLKLKRGGFIIIDPKILTNNKIVY